ncbi:MAG: leucine-rich repeat protein [Capnocytophaga leadbetteri]|jgi:cell surface protein
MKALKHLGILCLSILVLSGCSKKDDTPDNPTPEPPTPAPQTEVVKTQTVTVELPKEIDKKVVEELVISNAYGQYKLAELPTEPKHSSTGRGVYENPLLYGTSFQYASLGLIINNVLNKKGEVLMCSIYDPATPGKLLINANETAITRLMLRPELITSNKQEYWQAVNIIKELPEFKEYRDQIYNELYNSLKNNKAPNYENLKGDNLVIRALLSKIRALNSNGNLVEITKGSMKKKDGHFNFTVTNHLKRIIHIYPKSMKIQNNGLISSESYIEENGIPKMEVLTPQNTNYWKVVYGSFIEGDKSSPFKATTNPIDVTIGKDDDKLKLEIYGVGKLDKPFNQYSKEQKLRLVLSYMHGGYNDFIKPIVNLVLGIEDAAAASGTDNFKYDFRYGSNSDPLGQLLGGLTQEFMNDTEQVTKLTKHLLDKEFLQASGQIGKFMIDRIFNNPDEERQNLYISDLYKIFKQTVGVSKTTDEFRDLLKNFINQSSHLINANFIAKVVRISELGADVAGAIYTYFSVDAISELQEYRADAPYFTLIAPKEGEPFNDTRKITFRWDFFRGNFGAFGDTMKIDLVIECLQRDGSYIIETIPDLPYNTREKTVDLNEIATFKGLYIFRWKVIARHRLNSNINVTSAYGNFRTKELAPLVISTDAVTMKKGESVQVNITSGTGSYTLSSSNAYIATANLVKMNTITVFGKGKGIAVITVTDNESGEKKTITANIKSNATDIPDGVVIENGVLKKWPCNLIPIDGKVILPNNITEIGDDVFAYCNELSAIEIPNSVNKIGIKAFKGCKSLKSIAIPGSVETIRGEAFKDCSALANVTLENGIRNIEGNVFQGCSSLTKVVIPNSVRNMGGEVFESCFNLESAKLSENVNYISNYTFANCYKLKSVEFSSSLVSMEYYCFINCKSLTTLTFPKTFRSIGFDCFNGCSNLKTVNFKAAAPFPIDWLLAKTKATAYVPKVSLEAYQGNTSNVNYKDRIKALVTTAGD